MSDLVKVQINGQEISVPKGTNLIEAAKRAGADVPHFCYHPQLSIAGNCRMCMVEVEGMRGLPIACNTGCTEGMKVRTETDAVKDARAAVMEFLLVNHPIDCPVCDQAGECKLQMYYMAHDRRDSAVEVDEKVKKGKAIEVGPRVMLDQERCVACSRCVRFCDEVTGTGELRLMNRGDHTTISTWPDKALDNDYSVNTADICPVGALTQRDFRFQARVWFLKHDDSICPGCATGCNVTMSHYRQVELQDYNGVAYRLRPRENLQVNEVWMCDAGRLEYRRVNEDRIARPIAHNVEVGWDGVHANLTKALDGLAGMKGAVAAVASYDCTNEEVWTLRRLMREIFAEETIAVIAARPDGKADDFLMDADKHANRAGTRLVAGTGLAGDLAAYLKGRQAVIVLGADPMGPCQDAAAHQAFLAIKNRIVISASRQATTEAATIVLPGMSHAEKDGTWINRQGRVQRISRILARRLDCRNELEILGLLARAAGRDWPEAAAADRFRELTEALPEMQGLEWGRLGRQGLMLGSEGSMAGGGR